MKETYPHARVIGIQPKGCNVLIGTAVPNKIEGLAIGMRSPVLDQSVVDEMMDITDEQAINCMKIMARKEGILVGVSSGANICGSIKIADKIGKGHVVVTIAPDSGKNYLNHFQ